MSMAENTFDRQNAKVGKAFLVFSWRPWRLGGEF
jgi:hypothetical protein